MQLASGKWVRLIKPITTEQIKWRAKQPLYLHFLDEQAGTATLVDRDGVGLTDVPVDYLSTASICRRCGAVESDWDDDYDSPYWYERWLCINCVAPQHLLSAIELEAKPIRSASRSSLPFGDIAGILGSASA